MKSFAQNILFPRSPPMFADFVGFCSWCETCCSILSFQSLPRSSNLVTLMRMLDTATVRLTLRVSASSINHYC